MLAQNLVLILAIAIPVVLILVLRSNGAVVFLSLCAGALLVRFVGNDATLVGSALSNNRAAATNYSQLGSLLIPAVLSLFFLRQQMRGPKTLFNVVPALAVGLVGVLLAVPLLPGGIQGTLTSTDGWSLLQNQREIIVIVSSLACLVVLWMSGNRHNPKDKKHHKH